MAGLAERACDVGEGIAFFERGHFEGAFADGLDDEGDCVCRGVDVGYCQGDAFGVLTGADDYKLAALARFGDSRRLNLVSGYVWPECLFFNDFEHWVNF